MRLLSPRWPGGRSWRTEGAGSVHQRRVPACPVEAIFENDEVPDKWKNYIEIDAQYYADN